MKILFVRHGESTDDLDNQYGGWADFDLTEKGQEQLQESAKDIAQLGVNFDLILTSPLKRAQQSAEIISREIEVPVEIFHYAKERNSYGILSGLNKEEAMKMYPEFEGVDPKTGHIPGKERSEDFEDRVRRAFKSWRWRNGFVGCSGR